MSTIEQGFLNFSREEVAAGYDYALDECTCLLDHTSIRWIANEAGAMRAKHVEAPLEELITEAVESYARSMGTYIPPRRFEIYVRTVGHMFGKRNPAAKAKRKREHRADDELEASFYGLEDTPDIDPEVNYEIGHGQKGPAVYE